jgi:hypothetical protein
VRGGGGGASGGTRPHPPIYPPPCLKHASLTFCNSFRRVSIAAFVCDAVTSLILRGGGVLGDDDEAECRKFKT